MPNGKKDKAWIVIFRDPGREDEFVVWDDTKSAYESVARFIESMARQELEGLDWEGEPPEALEEALRELRSRNFLSAYDYWREYADEYEPQSDIEIIEAPKGR